MVSNIVTKFTFDPEIYGLDEDECEFNIDGPQYNVRLIRGDKVFLYFGWVYISSVELYEEKLIFGRKKIVQSVYVIKPKDWYNIHER